MGLIAVCEFEIGSARFSGEAHLEPAELRLKARSTTVIPFKEIQSAVAKNGALRIRHLGGEATIHLGKNAEAWALKIRYPRGRVEKLGVKPGFRVALVGLKDPVVTAELEGAGAIVAKKLGEGPYDIVLVRLSALSDLPKVKDARGRIVPNGMVWAIWPKGRKEFREDDIRRFGPVAGLVDVKVMSFSDELSGLKLVIPKAQR